MGIKKYLYQKTNGWVFGTEKDSICPAGIYRLDISGTSITVRHIYNRDIADRYTSTLSDFLKENGQAYATVEEFLLATTDFFSGKVHVTIEPGDVQIGTVELKNDDTDDRAKVKTGSAMAEEDMALAVADANTKASIEALISRQFAKNGIHLLVGTSAAPTGNYAGFIPLGSDTAISSITLTDAQKVTGANDFSGVTMIQGMYYEIPGGFSTITLSAGNIMLIKA